MSDPGSGAAAQPAGSPAAAQPSTQAPASQFIQVDPQEYQRLTRAAQQADGMRAFYDRAKQHGFDKPEAFDAYGKSMGALNKRGIKLETLASAFDEPAEQHQQPVDFERFRGEIEESVLNKAVAAAEEKIRFADTKREHDSGLSAMNRAVDEYVGKTLGKDASEYEKEAFAALVHRQIDKARRSDSALYPQDHPLHAVDWQPLSGDKLTPIFDNAKKMREKAAGAAAAAKGAAVNQPTGTPAGNGAAQGAPNTNTKADKPFGSLSSEERAERAKEHLARKPRNGAAVSSVGG